MSDTYSIADASTGIFTGVQVTCEPDELSANTPPGCMAVPGAWDALSYRVDGPPDDWRVVAWQPPKPADTDLVTHAWDPDTRRWIASPTPAALRLRERERLAQSIAAREAAELRPLREVLIAVIEGHAPPAGAVAKLKALEDEASRIRAEMPPADVSVRR